jgi:hypothetical protein
MVMHKEPNTTEVVKTLEAQEAHEALKSIEKSSEALRQEILTESEKETADFAKESGAELEQVSTRAEKDGLVIDSVDKEALQGLSQEANVAQAELASEIGEESVVEKQATPPPLPAEYLSKFPPPLPEEEIGMEVKDGPKFGSVEYYLRMSKIADKDEALRKLMAYVGAKSEDELRVKLGERDDDGNDVVNILTPEDLYDRNNGTGFDNPSLKTIRKIADGGDSLGYTFANTPGYEMRVLDCINKLKEDGKIDEAREVEGIFEKVRKDFEEEKEKSAFREIDQRLLDLNGDREKISEYIDKQKNLPPDAIVHLYHGLNGSYKTVLGVLNSSSHGVEQHSGPTLSFIPLGQFWKKGDLGLRYSLKRSQIEFPGEKNPNAVVRIGGEYGDVGYIENESRSLPIDKFEADVMRSAGTFPNFEMEKMISERLRQLAELRKNN